MFNDSSKIMFFLILISSTLISISSNSWLGMWMGLEINLLSFIPLMSETNNLMSSESSLKYFLTQALASSILLFSIILFLIEMNFLKNNFMITPMIMLIALFMKSGISPFHFWFPSVMEGLSWMNSLILMTWQKIAPLMMISYIIINKIFMICAILSAIIGALGGLNQSSLRKLMAFSSINHLSWMMVSMMINQNLWINYFLFYSFNSMVLITIFNNFKTFHINHLFSMFSYSSPMKIFIFMNLLSLGGLPPFIGFIPKWFTIQALTLNNQFLLIFILMMMSLITLFFYIRLCYSAFLINYQEISWMNFMMTNKISSNLFMVFSLISIYSMTFISLLYFLL
uniref:NADH-ubiquinone oxidoreductase chain 2 n=1 Tax=Clusiodes albimanus TaxID=576318 RepID=A0A7D6ZUV3_9MUSC|nr:NADH dehydrogenase subunit 2 [Clusiodes albimanus]